MQRTGARGSGRWLAPAFGSFRRLLGVVRADRHLAVLVAALLAIDAFWIGYFIVGKMMYELGGSSRLYDHKEALITTDGGLPEWFNYAKSVLVVLLMVRLTRSTRQPVYAALALIFLVVVLDDALEIHETAGRWIAPALPSREMWGMRSRDVGELIGWALLGVLVAPWLLGGLARSRARDRGNGLALLLAFGALLFCAAFVDQLYHSLWDLFPGAGVLLDALEDGGEMIAVTMACALALGAWREVTAATTAQPG